MCVHPAIMQSSFHGLPSHHHTAGHIDPNRGLVCWMESGMQFLNLLKLVHCACQLLLVLPRFFVIRPVAWEWCLASRQYLLYLSTCLFDAIYRSWCLLSHPAIPGKKLPILCCIYKWSYPLLSHGFRGVFQVVRKGPVFICHGVRY